MAEPRRQVQAREVPDAGYFLDSAVEYSEGWGFLFDYEDMMRSQEALIGDWRPDWLVSTCPALLVHGLDSFVLPTAMARQMAAHRPATELRKFPGCGHWVHEDDPDGFASAVRDFLQTRHRPLIRDARLSTDVSVGVRPSGARLPGSGRRSSW